MFHGDKNWRLLSRRFRDRSTGIHQRTHADDSHRYPAESTIQVRTHSAGHRTVCIMMSFNVDYPETLLSHYRRRVKQNCRKRALRPRRVLCKVEQNIFGRFWTNYLPKTPPLFGIGKPSRSGKTERRKTIIPQCELKALYGIILFMYAVRQCAAYVNANIKMTEPALNEDQLQKRKSTTSQTDSTHSKPPT